jgi:hypothetical protein
MTIKKINMMKKIFLLTVYSAIIGLSGISCQDEGELICMDKVWYKDADGDGRGDRIAYLYSCNVQPKGFVANNEDKDDKNPGI